MIDVEVEKGCYVAVLGGTILLSIFPLANLCRSES